VVRSTFKRDDTAERLGTMNTSLYVRSKAGDWFRKRIGDPLELGSF